jgi:hypothetical protein
MTDIDIQTAQLIIQLARDDLYGPDGSPDDESLSDLEFALAAQEQEFMQYWMDYGVAQVTPGNRAGVGLTGSGMGNNVGSLGITTTSVQAATPVSPVSQPVPSTSSARPGPGFQSPANSSSSNAPGSFGQANLLSLDEDEYEEESYPAPGPSTSTLRLAPFAPAQGATWQRTHSTFSSASSGSPVDELPILEWTVNEAPAFGSETIVREPLFEGEDYPPDSPAEEHSNLDNEEEPVPEWPVLMTPPVESPTAAEEPPLVDYVDYVQYTLQEPISPISSSNSSDSENEEEEESRNSIVPLFGRENSEDDAGRTSRVEMISRILEE